MNQQVNELITKAELGNLSDASKQKLEALTISVAEAIIKSLTDRPGLWFTKPEITDVIKKQFGLP